MTQKSTFLAEVHEGLSRTQKALSPKWLYDDQGSQLFEDITRTKDYYPTRTEAAIFSHVLPQLSDHVPTGGAIVEYGSGAGVKTARLIDAQMPELFVPVDIAADFLQSSADRLAARFPDTNIHPLVGDFTAPVHLPPAFHRHASRMGFFPGSTIGNLSPTQADQFLTGARDALGPDSFFLLGADLVKPTDVLEAAYDDSDGVTAAFNLNLLTRINRELDGDFAVEQFRHRATFNAEESRIEMHLVAQEAQTVTVAGQMYRFEAGETLHTENSHKFTPDQLSQRAARSGWSHHKTWTDDKDWFGVFLFRAA